MSMPLSIRVLFFGRLADLVAEPTFSMDLSEQITVSVLYDQLVKANPELQSRAQDKSLKVAINQKLVDWNTVLCTDDEVAFMPPVTGG